MTAALIAWLALVNVWRVVGLARAGAVLAPYGAETRVWVATAVALLFAFVFAALAARIWAQRPGVGRWTPTAIALYGLVGAALFTPDLLRWIGLTALLVFTVWSLNRARR